MDVLVHRIFHKDFRQIQNIIDIKFICPPLQLCVCTFQQIFKSISFPQDFFKVPILFDFIDFELFSHRSLQVYHTNTIYFILVSNVSVVA